jgi:hypothetical protein
MFGRIYSPYVGPPAGRICEIGMTSQALLAALVDYQFGRVNGVVDSRAVAVFADDDRMRRFHDALIFIGVTIVAELRRPAVFNLEILPVPDIGFPVPSIHVAPFADAETFRDIEQPEQQNHSNQTKDYP